MLVASTAAPLILPGRLFGADAPSEKITVGCIGWQGGGNLRSFLNESQCQVVAVCDVDEDHLKKAIDTVNRHYGNIRGESVNTGWINPTDSEQEPVKP